MGACGGVVAWEVWVESVGSSEQRAARSLRAPGLLAVLGAQVVASLGFGAILPTLPLFVHRHGLPLSGLGFMVATYSVATLLAQAVAGRLSDRWGRRRLMVAGLLLAAAGMAGFLLTVPPYWYILWRAVWGLGSGTTMPAAMAAVADLVPERARGRGYGWMMSASMAGLAGGPLFGALAAQMGGLSAPFWVGIPLMLLASLALLLWMPRGTPTGVRSPPALMERGAHTRGHLGWYLVNGAWTGLIGVYDTVWSIFLQRLGAPSWLIGLSWTVFAVPLFAGTFVGGRLADVAHRRRPLVIGAMMVESAVVLSFTLFRNPGWAIAVSGLEGITAAVAGPSLNAAVMADADPSERGAVQGQLQAFGSGASLIMAVVAGYLLAWNLRAPFVMGGGVLLAVTTSVALSWRRRRPAATR